MEFSWDMTKKGVTTKTGQAKLTNLTIVCIFGRLESLLFMEKCYSENSSTIKICVQLYSSGNSWYSYKADKQN